MTIDLFSFSHADYTLKKDKEMIETILVSVLIVAIGLAFMLIKVLTKKDGTFSSQHIHDSKAMKERGIHCVIDQDREARSKGKAY